MKFAPGATITYPATRRPLRRPDRRPGAGAGRDHQVQVGRRHHDPAPRRLGDDQGAVEAGDRQRLPPRVDHRRVPVHRPRRSSRAHYDQDQWAHAFGISNVPPGVKDDVAAAANPALDAVQWYWGKGKGTSSIPARQPRRQVHAGDHVRGPQAHAADPPAGPLRGPGPRRLRVDDSVYTIRQGYGRTNGLPYDEYLRRQQGLHRWPGGTPTPRARH